MPNLAEIGQLVKKQSDKPFKSGNKRNTIAGYTNNPHTNESAYTFAEDDSVVNCDRCRPCTQQEIDEYV